MILRTNSHEVMEKKRKHEASNGASSTWQRNSEPTEIKRPMPTDASWRTEVRTQRFDDAVMEDLGDALGAISEARVVRAPFKMPEDEENERRIEEAKKKCTEPDGTVRCKICMVTDASNSEMENPTIRRIKKINAMIFLRKNHSDRRRVIVQTYNKLIYEKNISLGITDVPMWTEDDMLYHETYCDTRSCVYQYHEELVAQKKIMYELRTNGLYEKEVVGELENEKPTMNTKVLREYLNVLKSYSENIKTFQFLLDRETGPVAEEEVDKRNAPKRVKVQKSTM
jgi:hypothetical protein